jgi:hypothetical protein
MITTLHNKYSYHFINFNAFDFIDSIDISSTLIYALTHFQASNTSLTNSCK